MDRRSKIIIALFVAVLLGIIVTELVRPKPINWRSSYTMTDKIPFGCYVLFQELPNLFSETEVIPIQQNLYDELVARDSTKQSDFILINDGLYFDEQETKQLLKYVNSGNNVFIASTYFSSKLADTLGVDTNTNYTIQEDTVTLSLTNSHFPKKKFKYSRGQTKSYFSKIDTLNTTVLGHIQYKRNTAINPLVEIDEDIVKDDGKPKINFLKIGFGKGYFYLSTSPQAYSNYYMLNGNQEYVANTLSYVQRAPTLLWDNYKKSGRVVIDSPMRFVLNQISLKWAYYLTIIGLIIFVIFKAKREQRIIPVVEPLENTSIAFAKTVGSLYYQHKNYSDLIAKKINYFLQYIRSTYYINTQQINEKTAHNLAVKSGKTIQEAKALLDLLLNLKNKSQHTEADLIALNKKIELFKKIPNGRTRR